MSNLAKGSVLLTLLALSVVFFYSQTPVGAAYSSEENISAAQLTSFNKQVEVKPIIAGSLNVDITSAKAALGIESKAEESSAKTMSFAATCYCLKGKTASGSGVRRGIVAADPRVLPLGTRISVDGSSHSGTYLVADTGGVIKGRILDIWVPSCGEAIKFGRKRITVTVIGKGGSDAKKSSVTAKSRSKKTKN